MERRDQQVGAGFTDELAREGERAFRPSDSPAAASPGGEPAALDPAQSLARVLEQHDFTWSDEGVDAQYFLRASRAVLSAIRADTPDGAALRAALLAGAVGETEWAIHVGGRHAINVRVAGGEAEARRAVEWENTHSGGVEECSVLSRSVTYGRWEPADG